MGQGTEKEEARSCAKDLLNFSQVPSLGTQCLPQGWEGWVAPNRGWRRIQEQMREEGEPPGA